MEGSNSVSKLRAPKIFNNPTSSQGVLREVQASSSASSASSAAGKNEPMISSKTARKARRSKSFCVPVRPNTMFKVKPSASTTNLARLAKTLAPATNSRVNIVPTVQRTVSSAPARNNPISKVTASASNRAAVKRPAAAETNRVAKDAAAAASTNGPTAPKLSKFDYKGRFAQLEEKHKALLVQHKEAKAQLILFEEENCEVKTLNTKLKEEVEELSSYKVSNADVVQKLSKLEADFDNCKSETAVLNEKIECLERSNTELNVQLDLTQSQYHRVAGELKELEAAYDNCKSKIAVLTENIACLEQSKTKLTVDLDLTQSQYQRVDGELKGKTTELQKALELIADYQSSLREQDELRRQLHNDVQDLKGNIRVFCRVRPVQASEDDKLPINVTFVDDCSFELRKSKESLMMSRSKPTDLKADFTFDKVFDQASTQQEIFGDLSQLVQSSIDGYHVCVFAYGQTGSGKTYTMLGDDNNFGLIPRSFDHLFARIAEKEKAGWKYVITMNFIEIYNETVKDLLDPDSKKPHDIHYNEGKGSTVSNLTVHTVKSAEMMKKLMMIAHRNRAVAATDFNLHSSRSHAVTRIDIRGQIEATEYVGSLNLVDLAGSESAKNSDRLTETKSINKSLSTLGTVMLSLYNKDVHVPYRNSKLTYLLQSCLGGNSKTLMIVNISPLEDCYNETLNSLRFAARVKEVKTGSKRNKMLSKA